MVGFVFCIAAIIGTFFAARRSLGTGLQALIVVGYVYGIGRGRWPDTFTHFPFDCAILTLYAVHFSSPVSNELARRSEVAMTWTRLLVIWPILCMAYSPLMSSSQPMIIQLVGLRGAVLMLPCLVLGARVTRSDLDKMAWALAIMNLFALGLGLVEYVYGIASVLPRNAATELIYISHDITAEGQSFHRIPACFTSSHAYGLTMVPSVPFLIHGLESGKQTSLRILCLAGLGAAIVGIFLCGARLPVIMLAVAAIYVLFTLRLRGSALLAFVAVGACAYYLVTHNERLQRFETLSDTDYVTARLGTSVNMSLIDALGDYPLGAGLASAFGTSVPFFLSDLANNPIGIESEFGHMIVEQGVPGLLLFVGFLTWVITRRKVPWELSPAASALASALIVVEWCCSSVGAGFLAGIPWTPLLLMMMGMRLASPVQKVAVRQLRNVAKRAPAVAALPVRARAS
jgi:hypothetical protein